MTTEERTPAAPVPDLSALDFAAAAETETPVALLDPRDQSPLGVTIWVQGEDSVEYRREIHRQQNKRLNRPGAGNARLSAEELEAGQLRAFAKVTRRWDNVTWKGEPLPCTFENALMLYTERRWIADQIANAVRDKSRFLMNSDDDSLPSSRIDTDSVASSDPTIG